MTLPEGRWRNRLTGADVEGGDVGIKGLLKDFPVALLVREGRGGVTAMHEFKVWAPNAEEVACEDRRAFVSDEPTRVSGDGGRFRWRRRGRGPTMDLCWRMIRRRGRIRGRSGSRTECMERRGSMIRRRLCGAIKRWDAPPLACAVIYELHVGTFTPQGTFDSAIERLEYLVELGITHVELMPVAAFPGGQGWGYDGAALFAVTEQYGGPDGLKRLVDACHARGLAVLLDVVYNHFGPVGNYSGKYGPYITERHHTPWGGAINFEGEGSDEVRRFFCDNALMWMRDYHIDGLRLDAVHEYIDRSAVHFMEQLSAEVKDVVCEARDAGWC